MRLDTSVICHYVCSIIRSSNPDLGSSMKVNFVSSPDGDVAAKSEEYKQIEDEGEAGRSEDEEAFCGIFP